MTTGHRRNSAADTSLSLGAPDRPRQAGASRLPITPAQHRTLRAGARDPIGLLPRSVNLRTLASLADVRYVGLDQTSVQHLHAPLAGGMGDQRGQCA
ncbi:hypothetical protein [Streptomyces mirabilis]|uniref:hypothetical protein n=1 Tax=Streptomyces mirabilis TaxID=68239 RepID=UPI003248017E